MARRAQETLGVEEGAGQAEEWRRLQRGWYLGSESFRDRLMDRAAGIVAGRRRTSYGGVGLRGHDEKEAGRLLAAALERLGLTAATVRSLKKGDARKQARAWLIKSRTVVKDEWLETRLAMGHRVISAARFQPSAGRGPRATSVKKKLAQMHGLTLMALR
jgi:hypothetical protein